MSKFSLILLSLLCLLNCTKKEDSLKLQKPLEGKWKIRFLNSNAINPAVDLFNEIEFKKNGTIILKNPFMDRKIKVTKINSIYLSNSLQNQYTFENKQDVKLVFQINSTFDTLRIPNWYYFIKK